jgi:integrase
MALGYRRNKTGGTWLVRRKLDDKRYTEHRLGKADDIADADGCVVMAFDQAQKAARDWWIAEERRAVGLETGRGKNYTVAQALEDYFMARERKGSKGVKGERQITIKRIIPSLGSVELAKLTHTKIRRWHEEVAASSKLVRTKAKASRQATKEINLNDPDAIRARRATANRQLTILKAALNFAFHEGHAASDEAWRKVRPFRGADAPIVRYLHSDEIIRLVNACEPALRQLVIGALHTGCRYGELIKLKISDFDPRSGTIAIRVTKSGKPRHVILTAEGQQHFQSMTLGKGPNEPIYLRFDGSVWGPSHQQRPLESASAAAMITPPVTFHILRHTYATLLASQGTPLQIVAEQLGHADVRMTTRHYSHVMPSLKAKLIRELFPALGIDADTNVLPIRKRI